LIGLLALPLVVQGVAMFFDEIHFHRRRGLARWERIGHPLDTCTVLACFALALLVPPTSGWLGVYTGLAAFSCLFITKDEWVHAQHCSPGEHWLHSILFVLHPLVLAAVAVLWMHGLRLFVVGQATLTLAFGAYQTLYWNLSWRPSWSRRSTPVR
jgi:hypothetical protein